MKTDVAAFLVILTITLLRCRTIFGQEDFYQQPNIDMSTGPIDSREVKCLGE